MAIAQQISVKMKNERGALATLCSEMAKVAVNIKALLVPDQTGEAPVRILVDNDNVETAGKVLTDLGLEYTTEEVIAARMSDRPGSLGRITRKLAEHGIDIRYAYGSVAKGTKEAVIALAVSDVQAAAKVIK